MIASIVITTYRRFNMLRQCLESCKSQTVKDCEFIVVDDGSNDVKTQEVINEFCKSDNRFKNALKEHSGQPQSINYGLKLAQGKYIGWLCDDDLFYDEKSLELRINKLSELEKYGIEILNTSAIEVWENLNEKEIYRAKNCNVEELIKADGGIYISSSLWKREIHDKIGYFPEVGNPFGCFPDWGWKLKCAMSCFSACVPELITSKYRRWHGQQAPKIDRDNKREEEKIVQMEYFRDFYKNLFDKFNSNGRWIR